jgi:FkbM family methyltransferase
MAKNILLDCGGYMGQTIDCFKNTTTYKNNSWQIYSFEAIPELYNIICKKHNDINVINKAIWINNNILNFYKTTIKKQYLKKENDDSFIYGQGSSLMNSKTTGSLDKNTPLQIEGLHLSEYIKNNFNKNDNIWLKLDVEGAEYEILEDLINSNSIEYINKLFIEFHYEKINLDKQIHDNLYDKLKNINTLEIIDEIPGQKTGDWFNNF